MEYKFNIFKIKFNKNLFLYVLLVVLVFNFNCLAFGRDFNVVFNIPFNMLSNNTLISEHFLIFPYSFKISNDGSLYLSNTLSNSILQFDFMGRLIKTLKSNNELFSSIGDIAFDSEGMIYFANLNKMCIVKIDLFSNISSILGNNDTAKYKLMSISQIEISPGNKIFVQDILQNKIIVYNSNGSLIKKIDCNVKGFALNFENQLIYLTFNSFCGFSVMSLDINEKIPDKIFTIGCLGYEDIELIGVDQKNNIYLCANTMKTTNNNECIILIYSKYGIFLESFLIKQSKIKKPFFVFGDGSIYFADIENIVKTEVPDKIIIKKY